MVLLGLLPVLCLFLFVAAARPMVRRWSEAVVPGAAAWGVVVVVLTEALGAASAISWGSLLAVWTTIGLTLALQVTRVQAWPRRRVAISAVLELGRERWLLLPVAAILALTLIVALAAPPNTFDSMSYHMSRVAHWAANGSVGLYPTAILRQLHMAPFAEYVVLHLYVLSGGDRLANLVQWLAMAGSLATVAAITRRLGGGRRAALYAVVVAATLPIGILEATGTKNDYVTAFWLASIAWLVLVLRESGEPARRELWLALGAATGLAILTKATAYVFAAPFLAWVAIVHLRRLRLPTLAGALMAAALALTLNLAFYARNVDLYGSPLGPGVEDGEHRYANERHDAAALASNLLRNTALQLATGSARVDGLITRVVRRAHRALGIDPELPAITWMGLEFDVHQRWRHEDSAPNPVHFVLLLAAPIILALRRDGSRLPLLLWAAAATGFLLFCAYLQWQPWHSRLHLPLLVIGAPVAGLAIARIPGTIAGPALTVLLAVSAGPALLANESRTLFAARNVLNTPRAVQYFANWPDRTGPFLRAAEALDRAGCRNVALVSWWNGYEYPLWALLGRSAPVRLYHVSVENVSARFGKTPPDERVCAVVATARHEAAADYAQSLGMTSALEEPGLTVFLPRRE